MTRALLASLCIGVAAVQSAAPTPSSVSVATVMVAMTSMGQPVLDLQPSQITAFATDGQARAEYLEAVGSALAVILMIDVSNSMSGNLRNVGEAFAAHVVPSLRAADQIRFAEIGGGVAVGPPAPHTKAFFTAPPALVERPEASNRGLSAARAKWALLSSPIWDGVAAGVAAVRPDDRHRLIVLITDGLVAGSRLGLEDAIALAAAAQTTVSVIDVHWAEGMAVKQDNQSGRTDFRPDEALRRLAAGTGGSYAANANARGERLRRMDYSEMPRLVAKAINESHGAYRLGLQIPAGAAPHAVKITTSRPGVVIRTPTEIRSGPSKPEGSYEQSK